MSKKNHKNYNRRDLLKAMGLGLAAASPMEILFQSLLDGIVHKALAANNQLAPTKYVSIVTRGAPARWMYDLFLKPYQKNLSIVPNDSVASEYQLINGRYEKAIYKTHTVKGIESPIFWTHKVGSSKGDINISDLMDNMIVLQGVDSLNPGHAPAQKLINRPLTRYSIDGMLADSVGTPFGNLSIGGNAEFFSKQGKNSKMLPSNDSLPDILCQAFEYDVLDIEKKYKKEMQRALASLNELNNKHQLGGNVLKNSVDSASSLMSGEIQKIKKEYPVLKQKYTNLINRTHTLSQNLKGISDNPVGKSGRSKTDPTYQYRDQNRFAMDADLREIFKNAYIASIADTFAGAEYVLKEQLTSTVNLSIRTGLNGTRVNGSGVGFSNDQHRYGSMTTVLGGVYYFRILSACMLELVNSLKQTQYKNSNMFDYTVIRQTGEFGRHPRPDGSGSDHSTWSTNCMLLSGMIDGPVIAGEIYNDGKSLGRRPGSWGAGGNLKHGPVATTGHVVSSIASMLGIESPSPNNPSLLTKDSGSGKIILNTGYIDKTKVIT